MAVATAGPAGARHKVRPEWEVEWMIVPVSQVARGQSDRTGTALARASSTTDKRPLETAQERAPWTDTGVNVTLTWQQTDPDGDALRYWVWGGQADVWLTAICEDLATP